MSEDKTIAARVGGADLVLDCPDEQMFRLHRNAYVDEGIFNSEMEALFRRGWFYVGHESQIASPGDFLQVSPLGRSMVLCRDHDGHIRLFYNRCRHRGALVCTAKSGNRRTFVCPYHGWAYKNSGELTAVPDKDGYADGFPMEQLGLTQVERLESYRGFIFAGMAPSGVSLREYLGKAAAYLDILIDRYPAMTVLPEKSSYGYAGNWKLQVENTLDYYHLPFVHRTFFDIRRARGEPTKTDFAEMRQEHSLYLGNGHGTVVTMEKNGAIFQHLLVFPNLVILEKPAPQIRVIWPEAVGQTRVEGWCFIDGSDDPAVRSKKFRDFEVFYGATGFGTPDDVQIFDSCSRGYQIPESPWNDLSRGLNREFSTLDDSRFPPFEMGGSISDDTIYRGLYRYLARALSDDLGVSK